MNPSERNKIILRTMFVTKKFENICDFIKTVYPECNQRIHLELKLNNNNIEETVYKELEDSFRKFLILNYDKKIEEFIEKETEHVDMDRMFQLILSQLTITFSIIDENNNRISKERYLEVIHNLVDEIKLK
ncbi:MAG TPA: hypothetical protein VER14_02590 [Phototrophicaceae bacterium]|nr:hypothetical protein [Phototrophicaceae bacterium]